jgi:DNA-directed RNA polymerase subunit RPC12/RpoP
MNIPFERSFASHPKSKFWSNKNKLNSNQIFISAPKKYLFDCKICNHEFEMSPNKITNNRWCPYCSHQKLCEDDNCKDCFNNSLAFHEKSKYWSDKNKLSQRQVFKSSGNKYLFNCIICNHHFESQLNSIKKGNWLFAPKCRDGTVGIVPRLAWQSLLDSDLVEKN